MRALGQARLPRMAMRSVAGDMAQLAFRVLGPLEATVDGQLGLAQWPARCAAWCAWPERRFGRLDRGADSMASGDPAPRSARHMVHEYVSRVRVALGDGTLISTRAPGYAVSASGRRGSTPRGSRCLVLCAGPCAGGDAQRRRASLVRRRSASGGATQQGDVALEGNARAAADSLDDQAQDGRGRASMSRRARASSRAHPRSRKRALAAEPLDERAWGQLDAGAVPRRPADLSARALPCRTSPPGRRGRRRARQPPSRARAGDPVPGSVART